MEKEGHVEEKGPERRREKEVGCNKGRRGEGYGLKHEKKNKQYYSWSIMTFYNCLATCREVKALP